MKTCRWHWFAWANPSQNLRKSIELYFQQVELIKIIGWFDFSSTHAISTSVKSNSCAYIELFSTSGRNNFIGKKSLSGCQPSQTPTQILKRTFLIISTQGIRPSLVSFEITFEALKYELFRFKFHSQSSKILQIPEFNLVITKIIPCKEMRHSYKIIFYKNFAC